MYKILIADDEPGICDLIDCLIAWKDIGCFCVGKAYNGIDALELIRCKHPDIVITDIRMPGIDGLQLIEQCYHENIHFIILSGYREFEYAQRAVKFQVDDYLLKPVSASELNELLKKLTGRISEARGMQETKRDWNKVYSEQMQRLRHNEFVRLCSERGYLPDQAIMGDSHGTWMIFALRIDYVERENMDRAAAQNILESTCMRVHIKLQPHVSNWDVIYQPYIAYMLVHCADNVRDRITKALYSIAQEDFAKYIHVHLFLAISTQVNGVDSLAEVFQCTRRLLDWRVCGDASVILDARILPMPTNSGLTQAYKEEADRIAKQLFTVSKDKLIQQIEMTHHTICAQPLFCYQVYEWVEYMLERVRHYADKLGAICGKPDDIIDSAIEWSQHCESSTQLLDCLIQVVEMLYDKKQSQEREPIVAAKKYVENHLYRQVTLQEVADWLHFSPTYFSTFFKEKTGSGFAEYVIQTRIKQAMVYLRRGDYTMAQIAERVGYADAKHFSKVFKKVTGIKPTDYRRFYQ